MPESLGDAAQIRKIIEQAMAASEELHGATRDFVTRTEFRADMASLEQRLEIRLENAMLKTRNWVLGGIIASSLMFGGGFITLLMQFNRTADAVISMQKSLDTRRDWIDEAEQIDRRQDDALKELKPDYLPREFETRPR